MQETQARAALDAGVERITIGLGGSATTDGGSGLPGGQFDSANFCCPEYLATMYQLINRNWSSKQQVAGRTVMRALRGDVDDEKAVVELRTGTTGGPVR